MLYVSETENGLALGLGLGLGLGFGLGVPGVVAIILFYRYKSRKLR
jgi:hypothetical protein